MHSLSTHPSTTFTTTATATATAAATAVTNYHRRPADRRHRYSCHRRQSPGRRYRHRHHYYRHTYTPAGNFELSLLIAYFFFFELFVLKFLIFTQSFFFGGKKYGAAEGASF